MATGPGKYDDLCTHAREQAKARCAILIVIEGKEGSGFSVQADASVVNHLPVLLEHIAKEIRAAQ